MRDIRIIRVKEEYINSYWYAFDSIAREKKYFASTRAHPYDDTYEFMKETIKIGFPSFLVVKDEKVVGFADARPMCCKIGYVGIGLIKEVRGMGLGKELMELLIESSREYGYESIEIDVRKDNEKAIKLYKKMNFEIVRELKDVLVIDGEKLSVIQMEKNLK